MKMMKNKLLLFFALANFVLSAQNVVPSVYTNIAFKGQQGFATKIKGTEYFDVNTSKFYNLPNMMGDPEGTGTGFSFDFNSKTFKGTLYYGFINYEDYKYPHPVYFKKTSKIIAGRTSINMSVFIDKYDMVGWERLKRGTLGYRVVDVKGNILYDGILSFIKDKNFKVIPTIIEGPILSILTDSSVVISYRTNFDAFTNVFVNNSNYKELKPTKYHEVHLFNLKADTEYEYEISCEGNKFKYAFRTAPKLGSRSVFTFAYASDARGGKGGGERNVYGTNAYVLKKAMALALQQNAVFTQFTGDLINGYSENIQEEQLEYANFKHIVSPFAAYMPLYVGIGNHEIVERKFPLEGKKYGVVIDRFPFETESMEAVFASEFANPKNGPESEDGEEYDPNPNRTDFPLYDETVYYYTYDNVAVVVLNSEYLYTPSLTSYPETSGGLHGYIMDGQLKWLEKTLLDLESNKNIDHIFITQHTPAFPNGGHIRDAMWYNGNNKHRTIIAGVKMKTGIIEQRDKFLDIIINKSSKVLAVLTGDEHNYCKTLINNKMNMYPENWDKPKLKLKRSIYQINNGACGAPYYAQEETPWSEFTSGFSTQNALVLVDVNGDKVFVRVLNPDTLEEIEHYSLK